MIAAVSLVTGDAGNILYRAMKFVTGFNFSSSKLFSSLQALTFSSESFAGISGKCAGASLDPLSLIQHLSPVIIGCSVCHFSGQTLVHMCSLSACESWPLISGPQARWQASLSTEPSPTKCHYFHIQILQVTGVLCSSIGGDNMSGNYWFCSVKGFWFWFCLF